MPEDKGIGSKILGLFVEREGEAGETGESSGQKSPADLVAEIAGKPGPGQKPAGPSSHSSIPAMSPERLAAAPAAATDFDAIFKGVGMDTADLDRVKKAEELLKSLPEATPQPVKKQIVEASLKAFGFEIAKIVAAAQTQLKAIDTYVKVNETGTVKAIQDAEQQIQQLNERIAGLRRDIEKRTLDLAGLGKSAQGRKAEVQKVIDFFRLPSPPSGGPDAG